jgi:hypothetical protein
MFGFFGFDARHRWHGSCQIVCVPAKGMRPPAQVFPGNRFTISPVKIRQAVGLFLDIRSSAMSALVTGTLGAPAQAIYRRALQQLTSGDVPFLLGGAYAYARYTGVVRHTKDLDLFVRKSDVERALQLLEADGFRTEITYPHWLAKAFYGDHFVDLIFNLGNGIGPVEDDWFEHAETGDLLGLPVRLLGPEEMIFSKVFTMDRGRFDGADITHLIRACGERLDWSRLLTRFDKHWRVLLSHLVMFGFVYHADRHAVPKWVMANLLDRVWVDETEGGGEEAVCQGTLLSPTQYLIDVEQWGYRDARLPPFGPLTPEQVEHWTEGVIEGR